MSGLLKKYKLTAKFILFSFLSLYLVNSVGARPVIKRVCASASDGSISIYWTPFGDTCNGLVMVNVFGYNKSNGAKLLVDTVTRRNRFSVDLGSNTYYNYLDSFYIEYVINCGGNTVKVRSFTVRADITPPPPLNPDSLSVQGRKVAIGWKPSSARDTKGYIIYSVTPNSNIPIDTVFGLLSDLHYDSTHDDPRVTAVTYKLAVLDSCGNVSALGGNHTTIHLSGFQDSCAQTVNLSWTVYKGWNVDSYFVYYSVDKGIHYTLAGGVDASLNSYQFNSIPDKSDYSFFVRASKLNFAGTTSSSNSIGISTSFSSAKTPLRLTLVSVVSNGVLLQWYASDVRNIKTFSIKRGADSVRLNLIANVASGTSGYYSYLDTSSDGSDIGYYQVAGVNYCNKKIPGSNIAANISLRVSRSSKGRFLHWNKYKGWLHRITSYEIFRTNTKSDSLSWIRIALVPGDSNSYADLDSLNELDNYGICYRVVAVGIDSSFGEIASSVSNVFCVLGPPIVRLPNAFVAGGIVGVFKPITLYADLPRCSMRIYDRWGQDIFNTSDIEKGWDGRVNGSFVPDGVYMYFVEVYGLDRSFKVVRGTFSILR